MFRTTIFFIVIIVMLPACKNHEPVNSVVPAAYNFVYDIFTLAKKIKSADSLVRTNNGYKSFAKLAAKRRNIEATTRILKIYMQAFSQNDCCQLKQLMVDKQYGEKLYGLLHDYKNFISTGKYKNAAAIAEIMAYYNQPDGKSWTTNHFSGDNAAHSYNLLNTILRDVQICFLLRIESME